MVDLSKHTCHDIRCILMGSPQLTITCDVDVDDQVDTPAHVDIEWTMSGSPLTSNDRVTVGGVDETGFNQYRSQVTFSSTHVHDSGIYNCTVNVTSGEDYIYVVDADVINEFTILNVTGKRQQTKLFHFLFQYYHTHIIDI